MYAQVQYPGSILFSLVRRSNSAEYAMWVDPERGSGCVVYMTTSLVPGTDARGTLRQNEWL